MRLWSIQSPAAVECLDRRGYLTCPGAYIERDYRTAYEWMVGQMRHRIGPPPGRVQWPLWAWFQWDGTERRMPDLRARGHYVPGQPAVRLELEVDPEKVLLSDHDLWHCVLNRFYLPSSMAASVEFEREMKARGLILRGPQTVWEPDALRRMQESWSRIFDLDWYQRRISVSRSHKQIQACLWRIDVGMVQRRTPFIGR